MTSRRKTGTMARQEGFEPPTYCLEGSCSILLSYWRIYKTLPAHLRRVGAGDGNRTHVSSLEGWCSTIELHPQGGSIHIQPRDNTISGAAMSTILFSFFLRRLCKFEYFGKIRKPTVYLIQILFCFFGRFSEKKCHFQLTKRRTAAIMIRQNTYPNHFSRMYSKK